MKHHDARHPGTLAQRRRHQTHTRDRRLPEHATCIHSPLRPLALTAYTRLPMSAPMSWMSIPATSIVFPFRAGALLTAVRTSSRCSGTSCSTLGAVGPLPPAKSAGCVGMAAALAPPPPRTALGALADAAAAAADALASAAAARAFACAFACACTAACATCAWCARRAIVTGAAGRGVKGAWGRREFVSGLDREEARVVGGGVESGREWVWSGRAECDSNFERTVTAT
eukprot:739212-Rhodomonas_salina.2